MNELDDLKALLAGHIPIITIETHEELRAMDLLRAAGRNSGKTLVRWSVTTGLRVDGEGDARARIGLGDLRLGRAGG